MTLSVVVDGIFHFFDTLLQTTPGHHLPETTANYHVVTVWPVALHLGYKCWCRLVVWPIPRCLPSSQSQKGSKTMTLVIILPVCSSLTVTQNVCFVGWCECLVKWGPQELSITAIPWSSIDTLPKGVRSCILVTNDEWGSRAAACSFVPNSAVFDHFFSSVSRKHPSTSRVVTSSKHTEQLVVVLY